MVESLDKIALALGVVSDPLQYPQVRLEAQQVLDRVKQHACGITEPAVGVENLFTLCASLMSTPVDAKISLESRLFGINTLEQLVTHQWHEFSESIKQKVHSFVLEKCRSICVEGLQPPFALKSKLGVLYADIARLMTTDANLKDFSSKNGIPSLRTNMLRTHLLPEIANWPGSRGTELACMVLRWIPEDAGIPIVEALSAMRKRILLKALLDALPEIMAFVYQSLNSNYAMLQSNNSTPEEVQTEYVYLVEAALSMILAYAEWAPITTFHHCGVIHACGILMCDKRFRQMACDVLRQQASVKKSDGKATLGTDVMQIRAGGNNTQSECYLYKSATRAIYDAFAGPCQDCLRGNEYIALGAENIEYGQVLCETLSIWGKNHIRTLGTGEDLNLYLQMMMAVLQHPNFHISFSTIEFWNFLVKEVLTAESKENTIQHRTLCIPDGFLSVLLDVIVSKLQKPVLQSLEDFPAEYFDSAKEYHEKCALLRQRLVEISRIIVRGSPEEVFQACLRHLEAIFIQIQQNPNDSNLEAPLEAATHLLYTATSASSPSVTERSASLETLLSKLLNFPIQMFWQSGILMQFVKCLEAVGGHKHRVVPATQCLLGLLGATSGLNIPLKDLQPARQQAATTVLALTQQRDAAEALCHHLTPLLEQIQGMWTQQLLRPGERNALYEAVLLISSFGGLDKVQEILQWLWSETCQRWSDPQWQDRTLRDTARLLQAIGVSSCACTSTNVNFDPNQSGKERVKIYHEVQLIERLSRRLLNLKKKSQSNAFLAIMPHFKWTVPIVIRALRCIHYMASPDGLKLIGLSHNILGIGEVERAFMLGITPIGVSPSAYVSASVGNGLILPTSTSSVAMEIDSADSLRTFVRGIRESIYQYLGIVSQFRVEDKNVAGTLGFTTFFDSMASLSNEVFATAVENIQYQDNRCIRMMLRSFICPMIRSSTQEYWGIWFGNLLPTLLQHLHSRLTSEWHAHLAGQVGQQQPDGAASKKAGPSIEHGEEILDEICLRELTRDHLSLLLIVASGDESGHAYFQRKKTNSNELTVLQWLATECVQAAACLLATAIASITWPDSETASKAVKVFRIALQMTQDAQLSSLQSYIVKDMFMACMSSLTLPSHADFQSEILLVLRDIIVRHSEQVSSILLSLPNINEQTLTSFHHAMKSRGSEKEQRNLVRKLILKSGGAELKALADSHRPGILIPQLQNSDFGKVKQVNAPVVEDLNSLFKS